MSEYLEEEEQLARLKTWWDENGTSLIIGVIVLVGGIFGWNWFGDYSDTQRHDATRLYQAYEEAEGEDKARLFTQLGDEFPGAALHVFALFDEAKTALDQGNAEVAKERLEQAVSGADDEIMADLARIRLAKLQRELDLASEALATLDEVRSEGYRALVLETKGDIHASRGEVELAHQSYQAAQLSLRAGDQRPFLDMKVENTAPFNDEYVPMTDALTEALKAAADTLEQAASDAEAQAADALTTTQSDGSEADDTQSDTSDDED